MIHTVGPVWSADVDRTPLLVSCYERSLRAAAELGARTVAFPAISTGIYGWPIDDGARTAVATVRAVTAAMPGTFDEIRFVVFDDRAREAYEAALADDSR